MPEEMSRRRCADRVEVIVLVQGTQQVERLAVQQEGSVARLDGAEAEVIRPLIEQLPVAAQGDIEPAKRRGSRRPRLDIPNLQLELSGGGSGLECDRCPRPGLGSPRGDRSAGEDV